MLARQFKESKRKTVREKERQSKNIKRQKQKQKKGHTDNLESVTLRERDNKCKNINLFLVQDVLIIEKNQIIGLSRNQSLSLCNLFVNTLSKNIPGKIFFFISAYYQQASSGISVSHQRYKGRETVLGPYVGFISIHQCHLVTSLIYTVCPEAYSSVIVILLIECRLLRNFSISVDIS